MTHRTLTILALLAMVLCTAGACSGKGRTTVTGSTKHEAAQSRAEAKDSQKIEQPLPQPAPGGERSSFPDIQWPEPVLDTDDTFPKREGAHFDNTFESWQVSGFISDGQGKDMDFTVLFFKTGPVMMLLRHGFASLGGPDGVSYMSFAPANIRGAAENELWQQIQKDPENQIFKDRLERLQNGQTPEFSLIGDEARVLRNSLAVNYGPITLNRVDEKQFIWKLTAEVQGEKADFDMSSLRDPVQFYNPYITMGAQGSLDGYVFPRVNLEGALTGPDGAARNVRGAAIMTHLWGQVDPVGFRRYTIIGMNFDSGLFLQTFRFYTPDGVLVSEYTVIQEPLKEPRIVEDFTLQETDKWTSDLSGAAYPAQWTVSGGGFRGAMALDDREHEVSVAEGRGAFYVGPCSYRGEIPGGNGESAGRGFCRLVAPQQ
jgi:predicted secreted hydrolase